MVRLECGLIGPSSGTTSRAHSNHVKRFCSSPAQRDYRSVNVLRQSAEELAMKGYTVQRRYSVISFDAIQYYF